MSRHSQVPQHYELHPQLAADTHPVAAFALCELRLMDDANYPWLVLVPRLPEARELIDLASRALHDVYQPHKLNVAALGNLVPQLHVHVIARYEHDPAWPSPVWGRVAARPYTPEGLVERIAQLRDVLLA